jgi:hypothetical protein
LIQPLLYAKANFKVAFSVKGLAIMLADSSGFCLSSKTTPVRVWALENKEIKE